MDRRSFLKRGLWGGALLALGSGVGLGLWPTLRVYHPRRALQTLDERQFAILAAVAERTVRAAGADPVEIAHRAEQTLALAPAESQHDFKQLLGLFDSALAGLILDGRARPFTRMAPEEKDAVLDRWRDSRLVLRRSGYHALRKITIAAFYSSEISWAGVGYGGPPQISVPA
jgi:hypothetical protein